MIYLLVGLHVNDDILYTFLQLSFEEVMQRAYETFHIELNSIQVLYALPGEYITTRIVQEIERGIREGGGGGGVALYRWKSSFSLYVILSSICSADILGYFLPWKVFLIVDR